MSATSVTSRSLFNGIPVDYATENASGPNLGGTLFPAALNDILQIFWRARNVTVSYALSYANHFDDGAGNTADDVGTLTGTYTNSIPQIPGSRIAPYLSFGSTFPILPVSPSSPVTTMAGTTTRTPGGDQTYSTIEPSFLSWFAVMQQPDPVTFNSAFIAFDPAAITKAYTRLLFEGPIGNQESLGYSFTNDSGAYHPTTDLPFSNVLHVQNNGRDIAPPSLFTAYVLNGLGDMKTSSITGSVVLNFNDFFPQ